MRHCPLRCVTSPGDRGRVRFDLANRYIGTYLDIDLYGGTEVRRYFVPSQSPGEPHGEGGGVQVSLFRHFSSRLRYACLHDNSSSLLCLASRCEYRAESLGGVPSQAVPSAFVPRTAVFGRPGVPVSRTFPSPGRLATASRGIDGARTK